MEIESEHSDSSEDAFSSSFDSNVIGNDIDDYCDITSNIQPYAFEPTIEVTVDNCIPTFETHHEEINNEDNWCKCERCHDEKRKIDQVCCCQLSIERERTDCLCNEEEFKHICLYKPYLEVILIGLSKTRGDYLEKTTSNRSYRFAAYSTFTWWAHGKLGRYNRKVIPSCIIWKIRELFPEEDGNYVNFQLGTRD